MTIPPFDESGNLPEGVHEATWDEIVDRYGTNDRRRELLTFANKREAQRARFGGELFPAEWGADPHGTRFLDYFQQGKLSGERKGIVALDLEGSP